ncbi:c-type cytochrome [Massilia sp. PWRC2]|uniref:c-type cytochrome n=1 Tax=Massilia sp. PWRC2 TaxID=2804626 RepID=UPI003CE81538
MKRALLMMVVGLAARWAQADGPAVDGKMLFAKNCAACHQASGAGIPGAFPALKANVYLQGEPALVIATVLKGRAGMPAFASSLDDNALAAVLSYARSAWGNQASAISGAQASTVREGAALAASTQEKGTIIH